MIVSNHSHVCGINDEAIPVALKPCRIIPTYVGSTDPVDVHSVLPPNHSHVCGINVEQELHFAFRAESFPRMWDQHVDFHVARVRRRIIPTYVGSTVFSSAFQLEFSNHSHVCGINGYVKLTKVVEDESFPRMWDQLYIGNYFNVNARIIPTYVGSTQPNY